MDVVDKVFYKDAEADDTLIGAYQIFDSEDGKVVLEDIMRFTSWGAQDPTVLDELDAKSILAMQRIVWRIKGMLNSAPQTDKGEVDE